MHTLALLAALTATAEEPDNLAAAIEQAEITGTESEVQIVAFNARGEIVGTIALWLEPDGRLVLASDYADGYAETVVTDRRAQTEATIPPEAIAARADAMVGALDGRRTRADLLGCALSAGTAAAACSPPSVAAGVGVVGCAAGVYLAACVCLPLFDVHPECPGD